MVTLGLAMLVSAGAAQDAKKEGEKISKGSIPAAKKALPIPDDQAKKIQAMDVERKKKLAELNKKINEVHIRVQCCLEEYVLVKRELTGIDSQIRQAVARLAAAREQLKAIETDKLPGYLIEESVDRHPLVQKGRSEIARLRDRINDYQGRFKRLRQMEQALQEAHAHLQTVRATVRPEVVQQLRKHLHRQRVGPIEEAEEWLKVLKEQHAVVVKEMNQLADEWARIGIAAFELQRQRAELQKKDLKGAKEKDPDKK
jgi:hypothetical protein